MRQLDTWKNEAWRLLIMDEEIDHSELHEIRTSIDRLRKEVESLRIAVEKITGSLEKLL